MSANTTDNKPVPQQKTGGASPGNGASAAGNTIGMHTPPLAPSVLAALFLLATTARAGVLATPVKLAGKIAGHGADNVAEHMLTHQADEIAEGAGKGMSKALSKSGTRWAAKGGALETAVEGAMDTARAERGRISAATILAVGGAAATVDAAHNLAKGNRERNALLGEAEKQAIAEKPDLVREIRADENRWKNTLACGGVAVMLAIALPFACTACGLGRLLGRTGLRFRRRPAGREGIPTGLGKRVRPEKRNRGVLSWSEERTPLPQEKRA